MGNSRLRPSGFLFSGQTPFAIFHFRNESVHLINLKDFSSNKANLPSQNILTQISGKKNKNLFFCKSEKVLSLRKFDLESETVAFDNSFFKANGAKEMMLLETQLFENFVVCLFGHAEFVKKRRLGKTADPFSQDLNSKILFSLNVFFYR